MPTIMSITMVMKAISRETRAPCQVRVHKSRPRSSVPKRKVWSWNSSTFCPLPWRTPETWGPMPLATICLPSALVTDTMSS